MGKKRVFEIAKDLGYQNRDLIEKLQKLGFDVKTHSSTVDEEDVRRALRKADDERRAKTQESRVSSGVIRRRPKDELPGSPSTPEPSRGSEPARGAEPREVHSARPAPAQGGAPSTIIRRRPAADEPRETPPAVQARATEADEAPRTLTPAVEGRVASAVEAPARDDGRAEAASEARAEAELTMEQRIEAAAEGPRATADAVVAEAPAVEPPRVVVEAPSADDQKPRTDEVRAAEAAATAAEAPKGEGDDEAREAKDADQKKERREARPARPDRKRDESFDEDDEKPELDLEELGISVNDFAVESFDRPMELKGTRVAPPPPSTTVATQKKEEEPQTRIVRTIDPNVLKARLSQRKEPGVAKEDWGKPDVAASPLTELVVRTDASGKRKELVDVRKEAAAKGKGGKTGQRRREEMSAKDLLEHKRGQVYYPTPGRKRVKGKRPAKRTDLQPIGNKKPIEVGETITVGDLAKQMSRKATEVIGWLMRNGKMVTINQPIDFDTAQMVAMEFDYEIVSTAFDEEAHLVGSAAADEDPDAVLRAPVVTVMGHVDHGKTSLLDRIRRTNVAAGEAGGITQRIAGYQVNTSKGPITFLDTPGHAAFSAMRARGADVTDIVILVVAADDGVMPQTIEAISHAKAADVPIIVAINKIDKPEANPDRVLQQLTQHAIVTEEWGGDVLSRRISAKSGEGVEDLLEQIALQAEILELKANPTVPARGIVIEAELHKGRGPVATILVQEGTLRIGDVVIAGEAVGKVRAMIGDGGKKMDEAGPSTPVQILGLDAVPSPGDDLRSAESLEAAKAIAEHRREKRRASELGGTAKVSLQDLFQRLKEGEQKELKIIVKADVQGSAEALNQALAALSTQKVKVSVISSAVGAIVESDVEYAKAAEAIIVGFAVRPDTKALKAARALGVDVRTYEIIYEAVDEVKLAMRGLLSPISKERYLGRAEVRQTFNVPKVGTVAGCAVVDGTVTRNAQIRLLRDSKPIYTGKLSSLKRFKDDVREVKEGFECGMGIEKFNDVKVGDIIEAFEVVMTEAALDDATGASAGAQGEARA
ncbi:translation initiation factor IF-2 [Myxococcota bacterium]|nr:translation initiation factor IF-2 [Myxococcota bacterium]